MSLRSADYRAQFITDFQLNKDQIEKFDIYARLITQWQKTINLIAPSTLDALWFRHFYDSAQLLRLVDSPKSWVDLGSGAGFPGLVCALLLEGTTHFHLIESDKRKYAFLKNVSRETFLPITIYNERIEDIVDDLGEIDIVSARALAPMTQLIDFTLPLLEKGAIGLFLKGQDIVAELTPLTINSRLKIDLIQSQTSKDGRIAEVRLI
jgi:16S rRNA (guanine527-N7)-methyltransferase